MRAIVIAGGGSKGAFAVGCLQYLLKEQKIHYDISCGISAGAILAGFISQYKRGEEKLCAETIKEMWLQLDSSKIYKRWFPFGQLHALWRNSFYNSSPLHKLIRNNISLDKIRQSGKKVHVGSVSLSSGKYKMFTQDHDNFIDAIIGSSSFPGMLSPIQIGDHLWVDGGIKEMFPIKTAIEEGALIIDIIMTSPVTRDRKFQEHPGVVDIIKLAMDVSTDKIMSNDIDKALMYNKLIEAGFSSRKTVTINIIRPDFNLTDDLLNFDPKQIKEMMECGYLKAKESNIFASE